MSNCSAAQSVKRSTPPAGRGTIFGRPVEPDVVSMNETSSAPSAGGHWDGSSAATWGSWIARRLALSLRGPWGSSTRLAPPCANSRLAEAVTICRQAKK